MDNLDSSSSTGYVPTSPELIAAESRYHAVRVMLFSTFDALTNCYHDANKQFPSSFEKASGGLNHNFRDTAIVLLAIEDCAKA